MVLIGRKVARRLAAAIDGITALPASVAFAAVDVEPLAVARRTGQQMELQRVAISSKEAAGRAQVV